MVCEAQKTFFCFITATSLVIVYWKNDFWVSVCQVINKEVFVDHFDPYAKIASKPSPDPGCLLIPQLSPLSFLHLPPLAVNPAIGWLPYILGLRN